MATTRRADLDKHIVDSVLAPSLNTLYSDLVITKLIRNVSEEARNTGSSSKGDVVKFPIRGAVTAGDKSAGTASTPTRYTDALKATLTINKHKQVHYILEDDATAFAQSEAMVGYGVDAAHAIAEAIEGDVLALATDASRAQIDFSAGLTAAKIATLAKYARDDKWVGTMPRFAVWGTKGYEDLLADTTIVNHNTLSSMSQDALINARIGMIHGFDSYVSNLMPEVSGSAGYDHNMIFQSDAMAIAFADLARADLPADYAAGVSMKSLTLEDDNGNAAFTMRAITGYNIAERGSEIVFDTIYGVVTVRPELLFDVKI